MSKDITTTDVHQAPTWLEDLSPAYRKRTSLLWLCACAALAGLLALAAWRAGTLQTADSLLIPGILAIGCLGWRASRQPRLVRRYATEIVHLSFWSRLWTASPWLALGFGGVGIFAGMRLATQGFDEWGYFCAGFLPFGLIGLALIVFRKQKRQLTSEAAKLKAFYTAEDAKTKQASPASAASLAFQEKIDKVIKLRIVRYPIAAALVFASYAVAVSDIKNTWFFAICLGIFALGAAADLALWLIGAAVMIALAYFGFHAVAALPVSIAIIIGALIIAGAVSK